MLKDTKSLGNNKASAWESRGFVIKKEGMHFDTPPFLWNAGKTTGKLLVAFYVSQGGTVCFPYGKRRFLP